jgi:hypothetical protein
MNNRINLLGIWSSLSSDYEGLYLPDSSMKPWTLKMNAIYSSETSVDFHQTIRVISQKTELFNMTNHWWECRKIQMLLSVFLSSCSCCSSFSIFRIGPSGLFPIRFLICNHGCYKQSAGLRINPAQNKRRHPCLEWDSNPQSQRLSGQRHFMP